MIDSTAYLSAQIKSQINRYLPGLEVQSQFRDECVDILGVFSSTVNTEFAVRRWVKESEHKGRPLLSISRGWSDKELSGFPASFAGKGASDSALYLTISDVNKMSVVPVLLTFQSMVAVLPFETILDHMSPDNEFPAKWFPDWDTVSNLLSYVDTGIRSWLVFNSVTKVNTDILPQPYITGPAADIYGNPPVI